VTDDFDHQVRQALQRRRRSPRVFISVGALAVIAAAFAYLWLNHDGLLHAVSFDERPAAAPVVDSGDEPVTQKDFEAFRRQMAESLQSTIEDMDAQKADLKKLSDQVSALTVKIDALQTTATPVTQPVAPARPPVVGARKKPLGPKTPGPISVGGAPLPPPPSDGQ
jgi:hypothetical protein